MGSLILTLFPLDFWLRVPRLYLVLVHVPAEGRVLAGTLVLQILDHPQDQLQQLLFLFRPGDLQRDIESLEVVVHPVRALAGLQAHDSLPEGGNYGLFFLIAFSYPFGNGKHQYDIVLKINVLNLRNFFITISRCMKYLDFR